MWLSKMVPYWLRSLKALFVGTAATVALAALPIAVPPQWGSLPKGNIDGRWRFYLSNYSPTKRQTLFVYDRPLIAVAILWRPIRDIERELAEPSSKTPEVTESPLPASLLRDARAFTQPDPTFQACMVGWPLRCLTLAYPDVVQIPPNAMAIQLPRNSVGYVDQYSVPLREVRLYADLGSLVLNVFFFTFCWFCVQMAPTVARRQWRLRMGRCEKCGYPRLLAVCSECGTRNRDVASTRAQDSCDPSSNPRAHFGHPDSERPVDNLS